MNKFKKFFVLLALFLFFYECGYTPIFVKKDINFSIEKIKFLGDRYVEKKINHTLTSYKNKSGREKIVSLVVTSSKNIISVSKNSKGEAQTNKISVDVNAKIILAENNFLEKNFNKTSTYTVINRKSEQKLTENKLIENLSNEIAQQIIFEILKNTK